MLFDVPIPQFDPNDIKLAFKIGSIEIQWYGVFVFLGFCTAILLACLKLWKQYKISVEPFYWFCLMGIPAAILGARFWSCCLGDAKWPDFWYFSKGGLAIEGGVVLTVIVACIWFPYILKKPKYQIRDLQVKPEVVRQVSMWCYVDAIIPCILVGQFLGRWGNYFNQELYGPVVTNESFQWFLYRCLPYMYINGSWRVPLFLYEGLSNLIFFFILYFGIERISKRKCGDLGLIYFLWYGILRTIMEPFRYHKFTFKNTYIMSGIWIAAAFCLLLLNWFVFPKLRKYRFSYILCERIRHFSVKTYLKTNLSFKKFSFSHYPSKKPEINAQRNAKINYLQDKLNFEQKKHDINTKNFVRKPEEMLYYLNK